MSPEPMRLALLIYFTGKLRQLVGLRSKLERMEPEAGFGEAG
jgi:hypothetical protein